MTSRERILAAINHCRPDRIPVDLGSTFVTGITVVAYQNLCRYLKMDDRPIDILEPMQLLARIDDAVLVRLGVDVVGMFPGGGHYFGWQPWAFNEALMLRMPKDVELQKCPDGGWNLLQRGNLLYTMPPGGLYFDPVEYPKWRNCDPDWLTDEMLEDLRNQIRQWKDRGDFALILNSPSYSFFNGTSCEFLCALLLEKEEVHERLGVWTDNILKGTRKLIQAVGDACHVITFGGDLGTQKSPLIREELYREMILPHFRRVPELVHRTSPMKVFYHTCGAVFELIEPLIEMGIDILNPIQVSAAGMEPRRLNETYGGRIVFWGGGCDTQSVLPWGTVGDVQAEIKRRLTEFSTVNGFVFNPVHNIQADVPPENLLAAYDEVKQFRPMGKK